MGDAGTPCHRSGNVSFLLVVILWTLSFIEGLDSGDLSPTELKLIFGDASVPEYSLFAPGLEGARASRRKRDVSPASVFEFNAFGKSYRFKIFPVDDLVSPNFVFIGRDGKNSTLLDWKDHSKCVFQGFEETDSTETIALVMCGKLRGVVKLSDRELVIEPLPERVTDGRVRRSVDALRDHIIYRRRQQKACPIREAMPRRRAAGSEREYLFSRFAHAVVNYRPSVHRQKELFSNAPLQSLLEHAATDDSFDTKSSETFYVETAVFVDFDLLRLMKINFPTDTEEQVVEVVLAMVNAVQLLYSDPSLGHRIKYVLKRLELLYHDPPGLVRPHDIDVFLTKFCLWQNVQNPSSDADEIHWDHALILTGLDLYTIMGDGKLNSQVVGLAPVAGMCTPTSSCTVNEGRHFESVYVVAHEIGHNLGMRHDGLQSGNNCDPSGYLMSPTLGSGKVTWSHCSKRYLNNFVRLPQAVCLRDQPQIPPPNIDHESPLLPGQRFSADQQCMLKNGVGSKASHRQEIKDVCGDLHCIKDGYTWTSHPALAGTTCGRNKWCRRGECVSVPREFRPFIRHDERFPAGSLSPVAPSPNGEAWAPWSDCKSTCLYGQDGFLSSGSTGLQVSKRDCVSCVNRFRYRVCASVRQCGRKEKRTLQDYADQMCPRLMREDSSLSGFGARIPVDGISRCEVTCLKMNRHPTLTRAAFPDGTVCKSPTEHPAYCVGGFCAEFRCEHTALYEASPAFCRSPYLPRPGGSERIPPIDRTSGADSFNPIPPFMDAGFNSGGENTVWGPWLPSSDCRYSCMNPSKGIQLVSRTCLQLRRCDGLNRNIRLCVPGKRKCESVQSPFKYASEVCERYSTSVKQLSGIGMQLVSTLEDPNRSCTVACQDKTLKYRFYRVNGKDGWFPFGTECSRDGINAYCLNGKCLEFSKDGTPLRDNQEVSSRSKSYRSLSSERRGALKGALSPLKQIQGDVRETHWRLKRGLRPSAHRLPGSVQDAYLLSLVDQINATFSSATDRSSTLGTSFIDLENPLFHGYLHHKQHLPAEAHHEQVVEAQIRTGHFDGGRGGTEGGTEREMVTKREYNWRIAHSTCSVTCGAGTMKQILQCTDEEGDAEVSPGLCPPPAPELQNVDCNINPCNSPSATDVGSPSSQFGKWLIDVVHDAKSKHP